jgi:hypothetical protein
VDLVEVGKLDVVAADDVHVLEAKARQALVDAARHAVGGEVESLLVPAALGGDDDAVPRDGGVAEAVTEHRLRDGTAVVPAPTGRAQAQIRAGGGTERKTKNMRVDSTGRCRRS